MIVIAIIGIIVGIALPSYIQYTVRTKNAECLSIAAGAKLSVSETAQDRGALSAVTTSNTGFNFVASSYCAQVDVQNGGQIVAVTRNTGGAVARFVLTPDAAGNGRLDWTCTETNGVVPWELPAECRP